MHNKHKYLKANDKKVLHKVKKQWVTISLALLMAIGGEAIATHVSANSNINTLNNKVPAINSLTSSTVSTNTSKANTNAINYYAKSNTSINPTNLVKSSNSNSHISLNLTNSDNLNHSVFTDPTYNQNFHFNVKRGIFGDVEALLPNINGNKVTSYDFYNMVSPVANLGDFSWEHFNTKDFTHFTPVNNTNNTNNIAIPSNTVMGSATSGSIIKNNGKIKHDAYGNNISANADLAYFASGDYIRLAYSNNGEQFHPYSNDQIIPEGNYGINGDFRDPLVIRNPYNNNEWNAYIAGGTHHNIFVFTSNDGIHWSHNSNNDIYLNGSGVSETPNIQVIDGKPVMFTSCEPLWPNNIIGYVYYTNGHFDNNGLFKADNNTITKLDDGLDNYAPSYTPIDNNTIVGVGRLQDWGYSPNGNTNHLGSFLLPRIIQRDEHDSNNMNITPIEPGALNKVNSLSLNTNDNLNIAAHNKLSINFNQPVSQFNLDLKRNDGTNNNIDFSLNNGALTIHRQDNDLNSHQDEARTTALGTNQLSNIEFYLDNDSVEAYVPEIHKVFTWADYTGTQNATYTLNTNVPVQANIYDFNLSQAPTLDNINNISAQYSSDKSQLNNDLSTINGNLSGNDENSANAAKSLLDNYFNDINNDLSNAQANIDKYNNYNNDARQHVFTALANSNMDMANTKLYQANIQLKKLDNVAAGISDNNIANYYKTSVANSVNAANQQKANQAAQQADQRIAQQQRTSVANSVATANRTNANHAAQIADQNILNQQNQSVANSVNATNQRTATSAENSADKSIESSIANSYAKSADTSIANSYKNSVDNSVRAANQSKANSAAKSADTDIANSVVQSADQSIENSEAKDASQQTSSQSQQPVTPFIPMNNVIPTPTEITSNSVMNNLNNGIMSSNSSDLNNSVATSSNVSKNVKRRVSKPVMKELANNQIPLLGLAKRTYFYQHDEAFVFTNRMKKRTNVLQATVWPNHHVAYRVRIGKRTGYMYGYLKELAKPELFTKRNMYIHVGKRMIKLPMKRLNRIKINHAVRYAGKNYMKYYVNYGRKRGVIYGKLPKITKRVRTNKGTYSKYYQVIPKRYHYVNVKKPLLIYNKKHFTKRNHRGSMRKGITIRVKRLVRDDKMTRFELMNGRYITGLKSFVKLMK